VSTSTTACRRGQSRIVSSRQGRLRTAVNGATACT
jgi:hypothetical protein